MHPPRCTPLAKVARAPVLPSDDAPYYHCVLRLIDGRVLWSVIRFPAPDDRPPDVIDLARHWHHQPHAWQRFAVAAPHPPAAHA